jgi:hypothetical protein
MTRHNVRRPVLLGAAWTASAAAAVGVGFLAVSLVDASAAPGTSPVAATSTSTPAAPTGSAPGTSTPTPPTPSLGAATGEYGTAGGTVFADCAGGTPVLAGVPAAGWWVDDSNDVGEMEFKSATQEVEVHVSCVDGAPQFALDDSSARSSSPSASPSSSSSASSSSGRDDDDDDSGRGRGRGGDDSGDDDRGGHGSDD